MLHHAVVNNKSQFPLDEILTPYSKTFRSIQMLETNVNAGVKSIINEAVILSIIPYSTKPAAKGSKKDKIVETFVKKMR